MTNTYDKQDQKTLLQLASQAIAEGLAKQHPLKVDVASFSEPLQQQRACFVTLEIDKQLRGCIGSLEAHRALVEDVAENAFAAAFSDPRFPALTADEFANVSIHISVLSPPQPIKFTDETDLLAQIRPGIDGLIFHDGSRRGTFLPSVWEQLPEVEMFFKHLKNKAGLPMDYWSDTVQVWRYTTEVIE